MLKSKFNILILLSIFYGLMLWLFQAPWWSFGLLLVVFKVVVFLGVAIPKWSFFGKVISRSTNGICLTFDDGPNPQYTPKVLDVLREHQVPAMFFVIGKQIPGNEALIKRMLSEGHVVANHSYNHHWKSTLWGSEKYQEEIKKTEILLKELGVENSFYRPPFGVITPHIAKACRKAGKQIVAWDLRTKDTQMKDAALLYEKMNRGIQKGRNLVLLHDQSDVTVEGLKKLIETHNREEFTLLNS